MHSEPKWVHMLRNPDADALKFWNCYYPTYLIGHLSPDWVHMLRNPVLNQRAEQNHFKVKTSFEGVSMLRNPEAAARFVRTL